MDFRHVSILVSSPKVFQRLFLFIFVLSFFTLEFYLQSVNFL